MTYQVQGKLTSTNLEAVDENTRHLIRRAAIRHSLTLAIADIHRGTIRIDGMFGYFGNQGSSSFKRSLRNFIQDETIAVLGLQGHLMIAEEGITSPVNVQEGQVFHQHIFESGETRKVAF